MVLNKGWALLLERKGNLSSDCTFLASVALVTRFAGATAVLGAAFQGVLLYALTFWRAASPVGPLGTVWKQIEANSSPENHTSFPFTLLVHRHVVLRGLIMGKTRGSSWLPKKPRKTNVFQIICVLASWRERWSLNYLNGSGASGERLLLHVLHWCL